MERLEGFKFDDVVGMTDAGVDTEAVVRTGMVGFMEGAMLHGIFHGDLHGGNQLVLPDGRTTLPGFGITGLLSAPRRPRHQPLPMPDTTQALNGQRAATADHGPPPHPP